MPSRHRRRHLFWLANSSTSILAMCSPGTTTSPRYRDIISILTAAPDAPALAALSASCWAEGWRYSYVCWSTTLLSCSWCWWQDTRTQGKRREGDEGQRGERRICRVHAFERGWRGREREETYRIGAFKGSPEHALVCGGDTQVLVKK